MRLKREQKLLSRRNHYRAAKYFNLQKGWVLHHKDETLRHTDIARYIEWRPEDLVPMPREEHTSYHMKGKHYKHHNPFTEEHRKNIGLSSKGRKWSEESKLQASEARKGINNAFYGKHHSEETKNKLSTIKRGNHWYTNGVDNKLTKICPEGYWLGRIIKKDGD